MKNKEKLLKELPVEWHDDIEELLSMTAREWRQHFYEQIKIDKYALDISVAEQPQLFVNCAGLSATASKLRDFLEKVYEEEKAEMDLAVRSNPQGFDLEPDTKGKLMETAIKSKVILDTRVAESYHNFIEGKEYAKLLNGVVNAFDQRKTMLRLEGDLWLGEYYSNADIRGSEEDVIRERAASKAKERRKKI